MSDRSLLLLVTLVDRIIDNNPCLLPDNYQRQLRAPWSTTLSFLGNLALSDIIESF
jgi:hypothetical protein